MSVRSLRCYECDTEYEYIGSAPHLGQCEACGSRCVPPAGELTLEDWSHWESPTGLQKIWLRATDDRDRPFEFEIAAHDAIGKVTGVKIDGIQLAGAPENDEPLLRLSDSITNVLRQLGITKIEMTSQRSLRRDT